MVHDKNEDIGHLLTEITWQQVLPDISELQGAGSVDKQYLSLVNYSAHSQSEVVLYVDRRDWSIEMTEAQQAQS